MRNKETGEERNMVTEYKCEQCGATLESFEEEGVLVIPACKVCVRTEKNAERVEPVLPGKGEE